MKLIKVDSIIKPLYIVGRGTAIVVDHSYRTLLQINDEIEYNDKIFIITGIELTSNSVNSVHPIGLIIKKK